MTNKMEVLTLLLMFFTFSGFSYVMHPGPTFTQIAELSRDDQSYLRSKQLRYVSMPAEGRVNSEENINAEIRKERRERIIPETYPMRTSQKIVEQRRGEIVLTSKMNPEKQMIQGKTEHKITKTGNTDETTNRNHGYVEEREKRPTSETLPTSIFQQKEAKREKHSVSDTVENTDSKAVVTKGNEFSLVSDTKMETNDESRMAKTVPTNTTDNREIVKTIESDNTGIQEKNEADLQFKKSDKIERLKRARVEEERESRLVARIRLYERRGDTFEDEKEEIVKGEKEKQAEKGEDVENANHKDLVEKEKGDDMVINNLTPPLSTSSAQVRKESAIPATIQIITQSQNPPPPHPAFHHHNGPLSPPITPFQAPPDSSHHPTPYTQFSFQFSPPTVNFPVSISFNHSSGLTASPGHRLMHTEVEVKADSALEGDKNTSVKPAWKELQTHSAEGTRKINTIDQPRKGEFISAEQTTPKPQEAKFTFTDLITKEPNPSAKSNENVSTAKLTKPAHKPNIVQPTGKPKNVKQKENDTKPTVKQDKASPSQPQVSKPSAKKPHLKAPSTRPRKSNRRSKNRTIKKSKDRKRKKGNKTQTTRAKKKEFNPPTHFPYFMDDYCPPECACYGRVVQCSDKGVDKVPYGIPYNAHYILLMNNHINNIQLDLLSEYVSMEFLVLSNNQLTDGAIEGAFDGVLALKRLYLDRNLLESVPTDLPVSLEELRLDNNYLRVMSEVVWARCPGLLVLSLSNNSLGQRSESLPDAVLSPLCNLRTLNLDYNQLTSVPLGLPLSIKELYLKGNLIVQFHRGAFNGRSELEVLDLSSIRLTNNGLSYFLNVTHLESLNLEGNRLEQVPQHLPPSLKTLNLESNLISSIKKSAFSTLKNLEHLGLARNKIFKVAPGAFRELPVLHQLDLCHNTLHQVPRQLPRGLHSVALTHNKILSVPHDAFCWGNKSLSLSRLVRVQLEHNLIDMGKLDARSFRCLRGFQVVHFY